MLYDRFGSELITEFDQFGSFGLATTLGNPVSYNFTTSPRYNGSRADAARRSHHRASPTRRPTSTAIVGEFQGIYPDLKSPYSILLNASFSRELPGKLTLEVSYAGRLSRKLLLQGDVYTPLENLKDPASGQTWLTSMTAIRNTYNSVCASLGNNTQNCDPSAAAQAVMNNPSLVPNNPYIQNMFSRVNERFLPRQRFRQLFLRHLWRLRRQLSGHAALSGPDSRPIYGARHLRLQVRLLHVLRSARQFDAHLDERRRRQLSRHDRQPAARLQPGSLVRFQLHAFAFHRQRVGGRGRLRARRRGNSEYIQSRANSAAPPISTSAIR